MLARILRPVFAATALALICLPVHASTISLDPADIQGFTYLDSTGAIPDNTSDIIDGTTDSGAAFAVSWDGVSGDVTADIGKTGLNIGASTGDTFKLLIGNTNENPWDFSLTVITDNGTFSSSTVELPNLTPPEFTLFSVDLNGAGITKITDVYITVGADIPLPGLGGDTDRTAEFTVHAVPLPAAVWLFGSALVGMAGIGYRRSRPA